MNVESIKKRGVSGRGSDGFCTIIGGKPWIPAFK